LWSGYAFQICAEWPSDDSYLYKKTMWSGAFWSFDLVILLASLYESISLFTIQSLQIDIIITGTYASLYSYNLALVLLPLSGLEVAR